ncbi:hypothetical protein Pmani_008846 [Petrolisthes manimaculis]|uniref:Uncharacterized protein n=1 Tax=Petrolisthes manimaculis TaxID=1843537 RepID=A0AAE1Q4Y8_9EUCA|nr:hypothetical protein Pmani_008846 [Petrolisthes manimaculis]
MSNEGGCCHEDSPLLYHQELSVNGLLHVATKIYSEIIDDIIGVVTEGLSELVRGCRGLKRLYLSALRTTTDHDLYILAAQASCLTQLDIMGTRNVTPEAVHRLLHSCPTLQLLDVSFCEQVHSNHIFQWRMQFPHVCIKGGLKHQVRIV